MPGALYFPQMPMIRRITCTLIFATTFTIMADANDDLAAACKAGSLAEVKRLVAAGAGKSDQLLGALRAAAAAGQKDVARYLIANNAAISDRDFPPLLDAAMNGHKEVVRLLLKAGAPVDAGDQASALCMAVERPEIVRILIEAKADVNRECNGMSPLHRAAESGAVDSVRLLLKGGAGPNTRNEGGFTPLHAAVERKRTEVIKVLLAAGAAGSLRQKASGGKTPLDLANEQGDAEIIALLRRAGQKTATRSAKKSVCTTTDVVLRSGPSRETPAVQCGERKTLPQGFRVEVSEETIAAERISGITGRWLLIQPPTGQIDCSIAGISEFWIFGGLTSEDPSFCK